ncbi:hypothetical protein F5051DRAFT_446411 [Lentinula edodes]|nr:hypothetical protein F5051DRAFT_446411 [Lentinula edodes]
MNLRKRTDSRLEDDILEPGRPKIRLVYTADTDELRREVIFLRAQLVHSASQQGTIAQALAVNNDLSSKLSIADAEITIKDAFILDLQKRLCTMPGSFDSDVENGPSAVDNALRRLTEAFNRSGASKNIRDIEEQNTFLSCWSNELQVELQNLDKRYGELLKVHQEVQTELACVREESTGTLVENIVKQDPEHLSEGNCFRLLDAPPCSESQPQENSVQGDLHNEIVDEYRKYILKLQASIRTLTERSELSVDIQSWLLRLVSSKDVEIEVPAKMNPEVENSISPSSLEPEDVGTMPQSNELHVTLEMMLDEKNKQLELEREPSSETIRQGESSQAKNDKLEKEKAAVEQEVLKLQLQNKELQSTLRVIEATNSKKLQDTRVEFTAQQEHQTDLLEARILDANHHKTLLEASLKQAWECKSLELKRKCEEFDTIEEEVKALKTVLDDKDTQLRRSDQRLLEIDSALQSYRSLEQEWAIRSGTLEVELTAAKQEVGRLKAENGDAQLTLKDMQTSASRVLQEKLQEQREERLYFDEALKEMNRCKDLLEYSLKEAWECKNQEFKDSQRELSNLQEDIKRVRKILEEKETQIQGNQREISKLEASLRQKDEENDDIDSIEIDHQMQIDSLQEDIKYFEATVKQLEDSCDSLEADLQSEEGRVRDLEATLLKKETEHALTCKSLEDRLIASRRHNEARVAKTLLTELQHAHDLQSEQFKAVQEKLILANEENAKVKDLVSENEQNLAASQGQAKEMQRQIMHLEYELTQSQRQIRNKDLHPTVSVLQDENLAKALRIKELQDILEYHKIDHRSTTTVDPSTMRTDQFQTPAVRL